MDGAMRKLSTKENRQTNHVFLHLFGPWRKWPGMAPHGAGKVFFPANPGLADIVGRTDLDFENFHF